MSINHYLLPVTDDQLSTILSDPKLVRELVDQREADVTELGQQGVAIVALTAESDVDPLAFIRMGGPEEASGWIGKYAEEDGCVIECEVDMGYGPASYYRNSFLREVARKLEPITADNFESSYDADWLEENDVYPGGWHETGRKDDLVESFKLYRACILSAMQSGEHLLVWCA